MLVYTWESARFAANDVKWIEEWVEKVTFVVVLSIVTVLLHHDGAFSARPA